MATRFKEQTPDLLKQMATQLRDCRPEEHEVTYNYATWERCFARDPDLVELYRRFGGRLSRGNVTDLGEEAMADEAGVRRFAMAVMMWGYGTVGYGATRTSEMLAHPQAVERLVAGAELVRAGQLEDACLFFRDNRRGALSQFGWSFFTKYFYFVGAASGTEPMPLILDGTKPTNGVCGGMKQLADTGDQGAAQAMQLWWSSKDKICAKGYQLYVDLVNRWAQDLGCRPDAIEMVLWKGLSR